jgi:hypothetical protein
MGTPVQPGLDAAIGSPTPDNGAQSPAPSPVAFQHGATGERTFTEADIAAARKQEKDKLYSEITSLKEQFSSSQKLLQDLQKQRQEELSVLERERQEKESAKKAKKEEEMSAKALLEAKLKETNETWESRFNQLQMERENERALLAKERAYNELVEYRSQALSANSNEIAPQFHNFITGETKEQIDNAIAQAKIATQSIADEVAAARQQQMSQMRGVSATGYTALGPMDGAMGQKQLSPQDIANMSMSEYAKFRQESGMAARTAASDRGILG